MLGGLLALLSAMTFAANGVAMRRGVLTGSVFQAMSVTVPIGVPLFVAFAAVTGNFDTLFAFSGRSLALLALGGFVNFVAARYCFYRATQALGTNLSSPIEQASMVISLALSIWLLGDHLTPLRVFGILCVLAAPMIILLTQRGQQSSSGFRPRFAVGYGFGVLAAFGYGSTAWMIKVVIGDLGVGHGIAAGVIGYLAGALGIALIACLPGQFRHLRSIEREPLKWFTLSGLMVGIAQMSRYAAFGVAPISVVAPIQALSIVFRFFFGWLVNRQHEVYGGRIVLATGVAVAGAISLTLSVDLISDVVPLPDAIDAFLLRRWPAGR